MDPRSFDALTRSLAAPKTRRGLLGGLAALGAGLLAGRDAGAQQVTQASCGNQFCEKNPTGCRAGCVCCLYRNARGKVTNSRCQPPGTCAPGEQVGGTTTTTTTTAAPVTCRETFGACPDGCACATLLDFEGYACYALPAQLFGLCDAQSPCPEGQFCLFSNVCTARCPSTP